MNTAEALTPVPEPPAAQPHPLAGRPLRIEQEEPTSEGWTAFQRNPRFRLKREDEVPRLLASQGQAAEEADLQRPTALAGFQEERRQILAICRVVCQATVETLSGLRSPAQLQRWLEREVQHKVWQRAQLMTRRRGNTPVTPTPLQFLSERTTPVRSGVWEAAVVFNDGNRVRACALRLQAHLRRWRVTALELG
ncbi:hypothetical protein HGQ17_12740 [Nesterenkonia sp. MY13]|uniref:3-hydroxyacyl-CoA dehydrogenase n=1 Tax=Nesterenkonia sedimenti TaxID=1463632 RepID=A0A7X8TMP2_9MICC|nr:Rv3235 family protein [Nesterenkonia sedimenti]NLS10843.1 hypothetical protein [Nesterenkonia sedimenti]